MELKKRLIKTFVWSGNFRVTWGFMDRWVAWRSHDFSLRGPKYPSLPYMPRKPVLFTVSLGGGSDPHPMLPRGYANGAKYIRIGWTHRNSSDFRLERTLHSSSLISRKVALI